MIVLNVLNLYFSPGLFALGIAVGVLSLVLILSLIISYAYDERTLLVLAGYLALMVGIPSGLTALRLPESLVSQLMLVIGPTAAAVGHMWLLQDRRMQTGLKVAMAAMLMASAALIGLFCLPFPEQLDSMFSLAWVIVVLAALSYTMAQHRATAGPWIWWFFAGSVASLGVSLVFLSGNAQAQVAYWPQVLMLLLQVPPTYLALVWRSRLLNESRLRSSSANVTDPLTGLSTSTVLVERIMRVASRVHKTSSLSAVFVIDVQNWHGLLAELGEDYSEKLLLEAALRLRRAIGDNDMAARLTGGRFAVVAQGLSGAPEVNALATRVMVSGLRIDSPVLTGIEFKFRIVVSHLTPDLAANLPTAQGFLLQLTDHFKSWPQSHRSRSILLVGAAQKKVVRGTDLPMDIESDITSDAPSHL